MQNQPAIDAEAERIRLIREEREREERRRMQNEVVSGLACAASVLGFRPRRRRAGVR